MIVPMKKVSLIITGDKKSDTLKKLRKLGILHIEAVEGSGRKLEKLKETLKGEDIDAIKADSEELTKRFYAIAEKLYKDAAPQGAENVQGDAGQGANFDNVQDADFKVVDENDPQ